MSADAASPEWKAVPPAGMNQGNPWTVKDSNGNTQAIISVAVPNIAEKTAKYIAALGTSLEAANRLAEEGQRAIAERDRLLVENKRLQGIVDGAIRMADALGLCDDDDEALTSTEHGGQGAH